MPSAWASSRSQGFGPTDEVLDGPYQGYAHFNKGIDFAAPAGSPIYAAGDGIVDLAGDNAAYGLYVRLRHEAQYATAYGHLSRIAKIGRAHV